MTLGQVLEILIPVRDDLIEMGAYLHYLDKKKIPQGDMDFIANRIHLIRQRLLIREVAVEKSIQKIIEEANGKPE